MSPFALANAQSPPTDAQILAAPAQTTGPVTLQRVMQEMIADGLKARYEPPTKLSHELFVLMMQINENDRLKAKAAARGRERAAARV
jgi:hypothetical protein